MPYSPDIIDELNLLARYNLDSIQEGIKIHNAATPEVISAAKRLYTKGLISQEDGGYLTDRGIATAEHAQSVLRVLKVG